MELLCVTGHLLSLPAASASGMSPSPCDNHKTFAGEGGTPGQEPTALPTSSALSRTTLPLARHLSRSGLPSAPPPRQPVSPQGPATCHPFCLACSSPGSSRDRSPPSDLGSNATSSGSPSLISPSNTCPLSHVTLPFCHIAIRSYLLYCGRMHCLSIKKTSSREQTLSFSFSGETSTPRPVPGS